MTAEQRGMATDAPGGTPMPREYIFLHAAFRTLRPRVMLHLGGDMQSPRFRHITALVRKAGLTGGIEMLAVPLPDAGDTGGGIQRAQAIDRLRQFGLKIDHLIFAAEFPLDAVAGWLAAAPEVMAPDGIISGAHYLSDGLASFGDAGRSGMDAMGLDVMVTADYWYMTNDAQLLPRVPAIIRGVPEPTRFGCMETDLPGLHSREKFLEYTAAGLSCRFDQNGGEIYTTPLPENLADAPREVLDRLVFAPPYQEEGLTEGRFLAFLRNARVAGYCHLVYSAENTVYQDTLICSRLGAPPMRDFATQYEKTLMRGTVTVGNVQREQLCTLRTPTVRVDDPAVLIGYNNPQNYTHWIFATLPRLWYREEFPELADLPIVLPPLTTRFQRETLALLGLGESGRRPRFIYLDPGVSLAFDRLYFPTINDRPHIVARNREWLRSHFLPHAGAVPEGYEEGLYFISRRDGKGRNVLNEDALFDIVAPYGFKLVQWSAFTLPQQIAMARHARRVICPHGSGLTNMVFTSPGCRLLEIFCAGEGVFGLDWFSFLVQANGGRHFGVIAEVDPDKPVNAADLTVPLDEFREAFAAMMES